MTARSRATSTGACRCRSTGYEDKRIYVWFEAVHRLSLRRQEWAAEGRRRPRPGATSGRTPARADYYFIGKDNIWFHTADLAGAC